MHIWFWAWMLLAVVFVAIELFDRTWYALPWAIGTAVAAVLEAAGVWIGWQWVAFMAVSPTVFVGIRHFIRPSRKALRRGRGRLRW